MTTLEAIEELARRGSRVNTWVAVPMVSAAVLVGAGIYLLVREFLFATIGVNFGYLRVPVSWGPPVFVSVFLARKLGRAAVRSRRASWISELALRHRLDEAELEEYFADWN